jgi:kanamycin kinase
VAALPAGACPTTRTFGADDRRSRPERAGPDRKWVGFWHSCVVVARVASADFFLPPAVRRLVDGSPSRLVWCNELGGLTFEIDAPSGRQFLKWTPVSSGIDLGEEIARLRWAGAFWSVPTVLDHGVVDGGSWMLTAGLSGDNAVSDRWTTDPAVAVTAIGRGLRALHDALPVQACPFSWSASARALDADRRARAGRLDPTRWHEIHQSLSVDDALALAADAPALDQLVVCHGDACAPNTLINPAGEWSGHVDLGSLGTADRWADLAVATWSTEWNYGPGWEALLLAAYDITLDRERTAYYRLLWDLDP